MVGLSLCAGADEPSAQADSAVGTRVEPVETWPIDVFVESRLVEGQPEWAERLALKLTQGNAAIQVRDHELDVACPVEIAVASTRVYRIGEGGWVQGGGAITNLRMPHDGPGMGPLSGSFPRTRLYLAVGPGYAFGRINENASYAWVGRWDPGSPRGYQGDYSGLADPWGRWGGWVIIHELGHLTGANHMTVRYPRQCSFMSYGEAMFPGKHPDEICPQLPLRMFQKQCNQWLAKARRAGKAPPEPADANRDGRVDAADLALVRAAVAGERKLGGHPPCLGHMTTGPCQLLPAGDANRDLRVDAADLVVLEKRLPSASR